MHGPDVPADGVHDDERQDRRLRRRHGVALAKTWGGTAVASKTAFPGLIPALNAKKCDAVISGIFITPDRTKQAGVVSYMHTHRVLIVKAGNPKKIHSPNQLKGLVVAVQAGTKYEEYLKALKAKIGFTLQSYPGDNDAVAQVLLGRADAVLTQDTSFAFQAKAAPGQDRGRLHVRGERLSSASTTARRTQRARQQIKDGVARLR